MFTPRYTFLTSVRFIAVQPLVCVTERYICLLYTSIVADVGDADTVAGSPGGSAGAGGGGDVCGKLGGHGVTVQVLVVVVAGDVYKRQKFLCFESLPMQRR